MKISEVKEYSDKVSNDVLEIFELLLQLESKIDLQKSKITIIDNMLELELHGIDTSNCQLNIGLPLKKSSKISISLYVNRDGQIIYNEIIEGDDEQKYFYDFIKELLSSSIYEEQYFVKGGLYKAKFVIEKNNYKYIAVNKMIMP